MRNLFLLIFRRVLLPVILFLQILQLDAQSWTIGGYNEFHTRFSSTPLQIISSGRQSLNSWEFVSKVGGVAFDAVALPAAGMSFSSLALKYRPNSPDGQRMKIVIDGKEYTASLPDWELIPIARYADSEFTSCVTLFGEESTNSNYHITFHPAFKNTLLGLRLLQTDIMFQNIKDFSEVLRYDGRYILGAGEALPDPDRVFKAVTRVTGVFDSFESESFNNYVFTDADVSIKFTVANNQFSLTGNPYYFFFLKDDLYRTVIESKRPTAIMKKYFSEIRHMNPLVYDAATRTMRYSAFFRYVKKIYPASWRSFLKSFSKIYPSPIVMTPTGMKDPNNN